MFSISQTPDPACEVQTLKLSIFQSFELVNCSRSKLGAPFNLSNSKAARNVCYATSHMCTLRLSRIFRAPFRLKPSNPNSCNISNSGPSASLIVQTFNLSSSKVPTDTVTFHAFNATSMKTQTSFSSIPSSTTTPAPLHKGQQAPKRDSHANPLAGRAEGLITSIRGGEARAPLRAQFRSPHSIQIVARCFTSGACALRHIP